MQAVSTVPHCTAARSAPAAGPADDSTLVALYARHARPRVAQMMRAVRLDVRYHHAAGDWLCHRADGRDIRVLDALGGYGSTFFGHNHPELVRTLTDGLREGLPFAAQASLRGAAAELAARLSARFEAATGHAAVVTLGNSGAEAAEAARKHATLAYIQCRQRQLASVRRELARARDRLASGAATLSRALRDDWPSHFGRPAPKRWPAIEAALLRRAAAAIGQPAAFVALNGSFHGKTGGALGLTHGEHHRRPYGVDDPRVCFLDPFAPDADARLRDTVASHCHDYLLPASVNGEMTLSVTRSCSLAALFFEPVQGEGGIRELPAPFLQLARELADAYGFVLVADEIQSGMGRTGRFFATEHLGVKPDYVLLSKSLGGGLVKIGALLVREDAYASDFGLSHTSTFAEDEHSARVALRALELLDEEDLATAAERSGAALLSDLRDLCRKYPHAFVDARGRGLLLGLELRDLSQSQAPLARAISSQGLVGYLAAGFLLHHGRLRIAPSLSSPHTLRIEPSARFGEAERAHLMRALRQLGRVLENQDYGALLEYTTLDTRPADDARLLTRSYAARPLAFWPQDATGAGGTRLRRVAFLGHFIHVDDIPLWEPSLERLSACSRRVLLDRVAPLIAPHPVLRRAVHGTNGRSVEFVFIGLTHDSSGIEAAMRARATERVVRDIQHAVDLAEEAGCHVIGLGGYTSIVTRNGKALSTRRAVLTTGNSFTAAMTVDALLAAARDQGIALHSATLGVLGAGGNIGQLLTRVLAPKVASTVLVGRAGRLARLDDLAAELGGRTCVTDAVSALAGVDLVVGASNSAGQPLAVLASTDRPRVVCDVAVPPDAPADLPQRALRTRVVMGGLVQVPGAPDFRVPGIPLVPGRIFACMAETMTLGLTPRLRPARLGHLEPAAVWRIARAARRAGLHLAEAKMERSF